MSDQKRLSASGALVSAYGLAIFHTRAWFSCTKLTCHTLRALGFLEKRVLVSWVERFVLVLYYNLGVASFGLNH